MGIERAEKQEKLDHSYALSFAFNLVCVSLKTSVKTQNHKANPMKIRFGEHPAAWLKYSAKEGLPEKVPFGLGFKG